MSIRIAVIATGARAEVVVHHLLEQAGNDVEIAAVYDPDQARMEQALARWKAPNARQCSSFEEAIESEGIDWVMVFSPNAYHKAHILHAFAHGRHVFTEKPLATSIEDCHDIYQAHVGSGLHFATGFVLRYAPIYRQAKEILDSGRLGRVLSIDANENIQPAHGGYIMRNWRRHRALSGPHILEKCCHDLDILNWFCDSLPARVAAFASRDFFVPENDGLMEKYGEEMFTRWPDPGASGSPFTSDTDLFDTHVGIFQYRNGIKVQFQATMSNAIPERRMAVTCTEGNLVLEVYRGLLRYKALGDERSTRVDLPAAWHGGGDEFIVRELYDTMHHGVPPKCSGNEGLDSAVAALAMDQAAREERVVDIEPVWQQLKR